MNVCEVCGITTSTTQPDSIKRSFVNSAIPCATTQSRSISDYTLLDEAFAPHVIAIECSNDYSIGTIFTFTFNTLAGGSGLYLKQTPLMKGSPTTI
jgi:hypothetical protein